MSLFLEISLILALVAVAVVILEKFRLPGLLGYLLVGFLVGPSASHILQSTEVFSSMAHFGVIILLFIIGIHLSPEVLKDLGFRVLLIGCLQIVLTAVLGILIFLALDFSILQAALLGLLFAISSTIVVLKLLGDTQELESLHGRIAIGILIIQDIVVSIALLFLGSKNPSDAGIFQTSMLQHVLVVAGLLAILFLLNKYLLPRLLPLIARNQESLFIATLAWGFSIAGLFSFVGLNLEIGALLAGVLLSTSEYAEEIASRLKPLRDFFVMLFFVELGTTISPNSILELLVPAILLLVFVSVIKPLAIIYIMQRFGYHRRPSFKTGVSLGQLSEFSFILAAVWLTNGWLSPAAVTLTTLVGIASISLSTVSISNLDWLEKTLQPLLPKLKSTGKKQAKQTTRFTAMLLGYNRVGEQLYASLKKREFSTLVIDFDPKQVEELQSKRIKHRYGDAGDLEFLQSLPLETLKIVISTLPSLETNLVICKFFAAHPTQATLLFFAHTLKDAEKLYDAGASFVVVPHAQAAQTLSSLLERFGHDKRRYARVANIS